MLPLAGVRVVDLTRVLSGPFCTAMLADLGAEVIKVEPPGEGDPVRHQGTDAADGMSAYFANYNRGKRSLAIDLYRPEGKAVLERLLSDADVLVENFRPDVMERMGFGPERLKHINPRLIACNINGFGLAGPYAERPAFDFVVQAMSGFMSLNGDPEGPPIRSGTPIADLVAGLYAALGVVAALHGRGAGGEGQSLSVGMLHGMISMLCFHATDFLRSGAAVPRAGNDHPLVAPYGLFRTSDGIVAIAPANDGFYRKLVDALALEALRDDPRFATNALRRANRAAVNAAVEARTMTADTAHWIAVLNRAGVPCGPVNTIADVFVDPQVVAEGIVARAAPEQPMISFPVRFAGAADTGVRPAPALGADTDAVLSELGYGGAEIAALRSAGAIAS